jgi:hypothetical protein
MRNALGFVLGLSLVFAVAGCQNSNNPETAKNNPNKTEMTSADACPHCPGNQVATADGKCPKCGMKVAAQ